MVCYVIWCRNGNRTNFLGSGRTLTHFTAPPNAEPESIQAAENALRFSAFHWGLQTWGVYTVIALRLPTLNLKETYREPSVPRFSLCLLGMVYCVVSLCQNVYRPCIERHNHPGICHRRPVCPSIFCILWFVVFGGSSLHQELNGINIGLTDLAQEEILFGVYESLPFGMVLIMIALLLISTFFVTSADSATFVLGMQTTNGSLNPSNGIKMVWGVIQAATASVLLASGGLEALQTASIASTFPFMFILLFMIVSLLKALREDYKQE